MISTIALYANHLAALSYFYSRFANIFCFLSGPLWPTIMDMYTLVGLPILGDEIDPHTTSQTVANFKVYKNKDKAYGVFMMAYMGTEGNEVSKDEHIRFLVLWLCRYMFCFRSIQVTQEFFNLTIALLKEKL